MVLRFGCQTYTWQMSYEKFAGKLDHILKVVHDAGFTGVEPEVCMLGDYYHDPRLLEEELAKRGLELAAICLVLPWRQSSETDEEKKEADRLFDYIKHFPNSLLALCQYPGEDRSNLKERQQNALSCINAVAKRASEKGIVTAFHPNSPKGSVFRTEEDYKILFDGLDDRYVGYAPDSGHIANGGMNPVEIISKYRQLVRHVHFKDITEDGKWTAMGKGVIDHPSIVQILKQTNYDGWIMVEEESIEAEAFPDIMTIQNGHYVNEKILL